jgi:hypothetical protein
MSQPIELIDLTLDVQPVASLLDRCGNWNMFKDRTAVQSPHREVDDIYARWGRRDDPDSYRNDKPFQMHWYYQDLQRLLEPLVSSLMTHVGGTDLGGVLITRIPSFKQVYPHTDYGWHATTFSKYCICVKADDNQTFNFEGSELKTKDGQVFWFDNSQSHWVINNSHRERISAIVCVKTPQGVHRP